MATHAAGSSGATASHDTTVTLPLDEHDLRELEACGAKIEVLADGSLVATLLHTSAAATDQAARAARCAMRIKARWPGATIALGTGSGLLHERAGAGPAFDRARALLRDHAGGPGSDRIMIDEVTRGLLDVRFVVERTPAGVHVLTGDELSVDATRPLLGKPTPCVGREAELALLEASLSACIEEGEPRAVVVKAPPGVGKSRLRHELLRRLSSRGDDVLIVIGRADPLSAGTSYGLFGQALRRMAGILDGESLEVRREKLARRIGERLPEETAARVVAFMGELSGVPFSDEHDVRLRAARQDPALMSDQITTAALDFLRAECAARPVLLVLEDLHWSDVLTVKLCGRALRALSGSALMVLALARPEVDELFPSDWAGGASAAQIVMLSPLSRKAGERLARQVLGPEASLLTVARIVVQSEGNALFLEELIRAAAEGGGDEASGTVLALMQARFGRLPAGARRLLRAASVFGAVAEQDGVRALLGGSMSDPEIDGWLALLAGGGDPGGAQREPVSGREGVSVPPRAGARRRLLALVGGGARRVAPARRRAPGGARRAGQPGRGRALRARDGAAPRGASLPARRGGVVRGQRHGRGALVRGAWARLWCGGRDARRPPEPEGRGAYVARPVPRGHHAGHRGDRPAPHRDQALVPLVSIALRRGDPRRPAGADRRAHAALRARRARRRRALRVRPGGHVVRHHARHRGHERREPRVPGAGAADQARQPARMIC